MSASGSAGRVLYRFGLEVGVAGRVLYRGVCAAWVVGGGLWEKILPARVVCVWTGKKFSLLALDGLKWAFFAVLGEFCTGLALRSGLLGEFCAVGVRCVAGGWWSAGENSPCRECARCKREIFRPACPKSAKTSDFCRAGRVFSRCVPGRGFAGRAVSRDKPATQPDAPGSKLVPATPVRKARGNQAVTPAPASCRRAYPWPVRVR